MSKRIYIGLATVLVCLATVLLSSGGVNPSWWANGVIDPQAPNDDYQVANAGQLKNIATAAYTEIEQSLAEFGGAGPDVAAMVQSFTQDGNYDAINQG
jgi:hypothetical protein